MEVSATSCDCLRDTELRLALPCSDVVSTIRGSKRPPPEDRDAGHGKSKSSEEQDHESDRNGEEAPAAKARVVGWPPIRSHRRNSFQARKVEAEMSMLYVKVSMDGALYLRKIDLKVFKGYKELRGALVDMFQCFSQGESSREEGCNRSEYAMTYEDKDGDWMLVGDVPWDMFISSCKRLRIIKDSEAIGLESSAH